MSDSIDTVRVDHGGRFMSEQGRGAQRADKQVSAVTSLSMLDAWL